MSNSRHSTNKKQSVLVLGHGLIQKINDTTNLILLLIIKYAVYLCIITVAIIIYLSMVKKLLNLRLQILN